MTKLAQIVAIEKGVKAQADKDLNRAYHDFQRASALNGLSKTYAPVNDGDIVLPPESTEVQVRVEETLKELSTSLTRAFDVILTKEVANCSAKADVKVDGIVIAADVPVTYLLFLEKYLVHMATVVSKLPILDVAETWEWDTNKNVYVTKPVQTRSNRKVLKVLTKAPATKEHPAQTETYTQDEVAGFWTTVKFSGALPATRVAEFAERVRKLMQAVKFAREEANSTSVVDKKIGESFFGYLFS